MSLLKGNETINDPGKEPLILALPEKSCSSSPAGQPKGTAATQAAVGARGRRQA